MIKQEYGKLYLFSKEDDHEIMSIKVDGDTVRFREECDQYYSTEVSKKEAVDALAVMIEYIKMQ